MYAHRAWSCQTGPRAALGQPLADAGAAGATVPQPGAFTADDRKLLDAAGALLTQTTETVSLGVLDFQRSADILVILILGGAGRLYGGLIGAIIFLVARDQFSGINPQYWYFPIGILLIAVVLFLPNGILGGLAQLIASERWKRMTAPLMFWRRAS